MSRTLTATAVITEDTPLSLADLCHACHAPQDVVRVWVVEGVLQPTAGDSPPAWRFAGSALRRARLAATLSRDLEVNAAGVALALDLMDRIEALQARLRRGDAL